MRNHALLAVLAAALPLAGCAAGPAPALDAAPPDTRASRPAEAGTPSPLWWNHTVALAAAGSAQAAGIYAKPVGTPDNCVALELGDRRILAGRLVARWDDPLAGELTLFTYQRDVLDAAVTGPGHATGPSGVTLGVPPSEERAREVLFVGVEASDEAAASLSADLTVDVDVHLLLEARSPPDPGGDTAYRCSYDRTV